MIEYIPSKREAAQVDDDESEKNVSRTFFQFLFPKKKLRFLFSASFSFVSVRSDSEERDLNSNYNNVCVSVSSATPNSSPRSLSLFTFPRLQNMSEIFIFSSFLDQGNFSFFLHKRGAK
jgi:hypothetical protein